MHETLQQDKSKEADFKYDTIFFQIPAQKYPNKAFWSQIYAFLFFHEILQLDKFEGADFKCDNSFFKIPVQQDRVKDSNMAIVFSNYSPKIRKLGIFVFKFKDFYFEPNFAINQI